jgi:hypothetical protein
MDRKVLVIIFCMALPFLFAFACGYLLSNYEAGIEINDVSYNQFENYFLCQNKDASFYFSNDYINGCGSLNNTKANSQQKFSQKNSGPVQIRQSASVDISDNNTKSNSEVEE